VRNFSSQPKLGSQACILNICFSTPLLKFGTHGGWGHHHYLGRGYNSKVPTPPPPPFLWGPPYHYHPYGGYNGSGGYWGRMKIEPQYQKKLNAQIMKCRDCQTLHFTESFLMCLSSIF